MTNSSGNSSGNCHTSSSSNSSCYSYSYSYSGVNSRAPANSSANCTLSSSPNSSCHVSANSSSVVNNVGAPPSSPVLNVGAPPPSSVVKVGAPPPSSSPSILVKEANTTPLLFVLFLVLLFFFLLLLSFCIIFKRKRLLKKCSMGFSSLFNSSSHKKYDVFISFRGEDTRDNFISHLHAAFKEKNIRAFIDDENMVKKESEISPSIFKTIEDSKISIVILSQDYASSTRRLSELVKIVGCMENNRLTVIPLFYRVDPSDVLNLTGSFGNAIKKHEESKEISKDKVQIWRACLEKVANLSSWNSSVTEPEAELIKKIANDTSKKLKQRTSNYKSSRVSNDVESGT